MALRRDIAYEYDGSFEGILCCVYDAFYRREAPAIFAGTAQAFLYETRRIASDERAGKVLISIREKIGREMVDFLRLCLLTCLPDKEEQMLRLIRMGYQKGIGVLQMLADPCVNALQKAVFALTHEAHQFTGFVRFQEAGGALFAVIRPKNQVLSLMEPHFCARFNAESFLIYDKTHKQALVHQPGRTGIFPLEHFELPEAGEEERAYQQLWRLFYQTIEVPGRRNERQRQTLMPKRYWASLTEFESPAGAIPHQKYRAACGWKPAKKKIQGAQMGD